MSGTRSNLEGFDGGDATVRLPLIVVARERPLQVSPCVSQVDGFLHGDVAPVGNLDGACDAADGEEWVVVLIVDLQGVLQCKKKNRCTLSLRQKILISKLGRIPRQQTHILLKMYPK